MGKMKCAEAYGSYAEYYRALRTMAAEYADLPMDGVWNAWMRASAAVNPMMQNRRVKSVSTMPQDYGKEDITRMLKAPNESEQALRQVSHTLEWTAYPYRKIRMTYQAVNTYHYYHYPAYVSRDEAAGEQLRREGRLLDKLNRTLRPDQWAHQIAGQVIQEGKVAYVPRWSCDKAHNQVNYAFLQQLPSDWFKIVGFNAASKYTVMFNMMYFLQPGADWRQFGDLFVPYLDDFSQILVPAGKIPAGADGKRYVYAARNTVHSADGRTFRIDLETFNSRKAGAAGAPELYNQNGSWAYWVTLPVDRVWVFEADDTTPTAVSPLTGLFLAFDQLSALEDVQMAILQNPLVQICLGEIPYTDGSDARAADPYKLSPSGRATFMSYWYQMLEAANTGGIGLYFAPVEHLHMESLQEAPNATNISTAGYAYAVQKSGLSGLVPINSDPRAGAVHLSATLEERYLACVYGQMEHMMQSIYRQIGTKFEWRFQMFGGFLSDEAELENARKGLQMGMLSETLKYLALRGISIWEDLGISNLVKESGILDLRIPPVTSFTMKKDGQSMPPNDPDSVGGRPTEGIGEAIRGGKESQESDLDGE